MCRMDMALTNTVFGPSFFSREDLRPQNTRAIFRSISIPLSSRLLPCTETSLPFSRTSASARRPCLLVKAELNSYGDVSGGPPKGSSLRADSSIKVAGGGIMEALQNVTPVVAIKWTAICAIAIAAARAAYNVLFDPFLWTYGSWFLVVWPLPAAMALGIWSVIAALPLEFNKRNSRSRKENEQIFILAGALTWLILVPLGFRHGYIQGLPLLLFLVYWYFFMISAIIRLRKYGELTPKSEDKQWSSSPSRIAQISFGLTVIGGHWLAAYEAPHLYFPWNWKWPSLIAVMVIGLAVVLHYNATYFLGKYFDRLVKPRQLVVFGPYRIVRHPIYASYILLFAGYCAALRSYKSLAFLVLACLLYYEQRVRLEEEMLEEAFGKEQYDLYRKQTKYKFFPFLY